MEHLISPIPVKPWTLNGLSERMIVSHYEDIYGAAVRELNAIRDELERLDFGAPPFRLRALKQEEISAMNSVLLHELYFANLGGEGNVIPAEMRNVLDAHFGSAQEWRREFVAAAQSMIGRSGWVVLTYARRSGRVAIDIACDSTPIAVDSAPLLVLDMYEHAYHPDFGFNAKAYIDAFLRNIEWKAVMQRLSSATAERTPPVEEPADPTLPSMTVEELASRLGNGEAMQVIDARPRHHISRNTDQMQGATWHDPDNVPEWIDELAPGQPVAVYCAYGFHVGCNVTRALRERGIDARYVRGGVSAWYASGGPRATRKPEEE